MAKTRAAPTLTIDGEVFPTAAPFVPGKGNLSALREAVQSCRGCPLYRDATQAVFGEGPSRARWIFVGEQPGDREDLEGRPFVGPAGRVLDEILEEAGVPRDRVYVTNAVKHFKFEPRGKRRLHQRPRTREIAACRPWLDAELRALRPRAIVALGATAAQAFLGSSFRITTHRGEIFRDRIEAAGIFMATHHPSAVLRERDADARARMRGELVDDVRALADLLDGEP